MLLNAICAGLPHVAIAEVDTAAPDTPTGIFVDEGPNWRSNNQFHVWWHTPPDQATPIAVAHYELCPAVPVGPCTQHQLAEENISELDISLPYTGWFWLRVWLEDAAGNVNPNAKSPEAMLRFDDVAPSVGFLRHNDEWIGGESPDSPIYPISIAADADWPVSGIRGYSVTLNGGIPDAEVEVFATQDYERFEALYEVDHLPEGTTMVLTRSVSNSGVPSDAVGTAYLRLDRSPPVIDGSGLPSEEGWHRKALSVLLLAKDQDNLSGMSPTPDDGPVEDDAHLAYEIDGSATHRLPGSETRLPVDADGRHTLTYRAFDAAGNASVQKEVVFRIDATAPSGAFRALDPGDPRKLEVAVEDATSGVADGRIEYRRVGEGFKALVTKVGAGVLSARIDDEGLPAGRYELRAVVRDIAGNEAVIDRWADGSATTLGMPLRLGAHVEVAGSVKAKRCGKAAKRRGTKQGRKRSRRQRCRRTPTAARSLELPYGKRAASSGRLTTSQGAAIPGASVVVEGQARSGGAFVRLGAASTDPQGRFRFAIPAGPSRTVRYRYDGTDTVRPATAAITTKVGAAARLGVDRRRVRNGQAVRFSGRLLGKPIPAAGKVVALQAKVGRQWRTFANPRANAKGVFKHRYRFTATTGLRRYAFRAVVTREAAYPYEVGRSPTVRVTVRGGGR